MENKIFINSSLKLICTNFFGNVLTFLFQVVTAHYLSVAEYGNLNSVIAFSGFFALIFAPAQNFIVLELSKFKAKNRIIDGFIKFIFRRFLVYCLVVSIVPLAVSFFYGHASHIQLLDILLSLAFIVLYIPINSITGVYQGIQDFNKLALLSLMQPLLYVLLGGGMALLGRGAAGVLAGRILAILLCILLFLPHVVHRFQANDEYNLNAKYALRYILFTGIIYACNNMLMQADTLLVRYFFSAYDTGLYLSASTIGKTVLYVPSAFMLILFPLIAENAAKGQSNSVIFVRTIFFYIVIEIVISILIFFAGNLIVNTFFGESFISAIQLIRFSGIAFMPVGLISLFFTFFLAKESYKCIYPMLVSVLVEIFGVLVFHKHIYQALISIFISCCIGLILFIYLVYADYSKKRNPLINEY